MPVYELIRHDSDTADREYTTPDGRFPSVTAVLSGSRDQSGLEAWRESVGQERARVITETACFRGSALHSGIETFLTDGSTPAFSFLVTPFWKSVEPFVRTVEHPLLMEAPVWHPAGYAGTVDCVAYLPESGSQPYLLDWKSATKPCNPQKKYEYAIQLGAYTAALNHVYKPQGLCITEACLVVAMPCQAPQVERYGEDDLRQLFRHFQARLERYTYAKRSRR